MQGDKFKNFILNRKIQILGGKFLKIKIFFDFLKYGDHFFERNLENYKILWKFFKKNKKLHDDLVEKNRQKWKFVDKARHYLLTWGKFSENFDPEISKCPNCRQGYLKKSFIFEISEILSWCSSSWSEKIQNFQKIFGKIFKIFWNFRKILKIFDEKSTGRQDNTIR